MYSIKAKINSSHTSASSTATIATQTNSIVLPKVNIYAVTSDNMIYVLKPGSTAYTSVGRVARSFGNLIGIDFRPADGSTTSVYGLTDTGNLLLINLATSPLGVTKVTTLNTSFAGGFQSLMDFNPVANALRLIGSNDQNFALLNANGGNLNNTVPQTKLAYAAGDVNAGVDPNIMGGAYTNNYPGAPFTIFYAFDYNLDTFVTIAGRVAPGSSPTGGGQLQTIGSVVDAFGNPMNFNPTADIDIYTDANGVNFLVGINNENIFTIDLSQIDTALAVGTTQKVVANSVKLPATPSADAFLDVALPTIAAAPVMAPTPTPTPTPTPANMARCTVSYKVTSQWDVGFITNIIIQNNTGINLNGWQFTWQFTGSQSITNLWNGVVSTGSQTVKVNNAVYNANFASGSTIQLGFEGRYSGTNPLPINFALNGNPCDRR